MIGAVYGLLSPALISRPMIGWVSVVLLLVTNHVPPARETRCLTYFLMIGTFRNTRLHARTRGNVLWEVSNPVSPDNPDRVFL